MSNNDDDIMLVNPVTIAKLAANFAKIAAAEAASAAKISHHLMLENRTLALGL